MEIRIKQAVPTAVPVENSVTDSGNDLMVARDSSQPERGPSQIAQSDIVTQVPFAS